MVNIGIRMKKKNFLLIAMLLSACLSQFSSDVYAPVLGHIANELNASVQSVQLSMVIYLWGIAASLLVYGAFSEIFGRKKPLLFGLMIFFFGNMICMMSQHVDTLILGRFLQGLGAGSAAGLWRAIFRDIFIGEQLAKYASYFAVMIMFFVPAAPALGGSVEHWLGWRAIFVLMNLYTVITFLFICFAYRETNQYIDRRKMSFLYIVTSYCRLIKQSIFLRMILCSFFCYGALFSWFTAGPLLLTHTLNLSPMQFGWISALAGGGAYGLAGYLNARLVTHWGMQKMMRMGLSMMLLSGVLMFAGYYVFGVNAWDIFIPAIIFYFGSTWIWPNAFAQAMTPFAELAGYAGALYSFMQLAGGAVLGLLVARLSVMNQLPLAIVFIVSSLLAMSLV